MAKAVLAIGLDPAFVDFTAFPQLTPALVRHYLDSQIERLRTLGYDADSCFTDVGDTAEQVTTAALMSKRYDCIVIDSAPLRSATEARLLASMVDKILFAIKWGSTPREVAQNALELLRFAELCQVA